jgi:hypothetical protein
MAATEPADHGVAAEPDRVSTRLVTRFGVILVILSVAAMLLMAALFQLLDRGAERRDAAARASAGMERRPDRLPPPPRLEVYGSRHWQQFRSAEEARLSSYGWLNRSTGAVHIPIERAMDLITERGVAALPPAPLALRPPPATLPVTPAAPGARP